MEYKNQILQIYKDMKFTITDDSGDFTDCQVAYEAVKEYLEGKIDFDRLMIEVDGICPPNANYFCNDDDCNCELSCDIAKVDEDGIIRGGDCKKCWNRCLGIRIKEKQKLHLLTISDKFFEMCYRYNVTSANYCENNKGYKCPYSPIREKMRTDIDCFIAWLRDNYNIELKEK